MSHGKHSIDLAVRSGFQAIALLLVLGISGPKLSAQFDGYTLTPLENLNTTDDEVLIGWDGRTIYFSRSDRSDDDKGNPGWFRQEKSDWESQRTQGWTDFESHIPLCCGHSQVPIGRDLTPSSTLQLTKPGAFWS